MIRIVFAGSPAIAVPSLETLFNPAGNFELAGVITNPDSPKGRSGIALPTEVGVAVQKLSSAKGPDKPPLPLFKPVKLDISVRQEIAALKPDLLVCFAYGRIFGPKFLELFPLGGVNIHPSLLPRYRGPSPIPAAILNGDTETGISVQRLAAEMDSGEILWQERIPLDGRETAGSLGDIVAKKAAQILPEFLLDFASGALSGQSQNNLEASYCPLITAQDGQIDWKKSAADIDAMIRAFDPWPLCWTKHGNQRLFILKAEKYEPEQSSDFRPAAGTAPAMVLGIDKKRGILVQTGEGILAVRELQYSSKKALHWRDFLNGARNFTGSLLAG